MNKANIPSNNTDAERAVLGCCLVDPDGIMKVADILSGDEFYEHRNSVIYKAILHLFHNRVGVDVLTVATRLTDTKEIDAAGGEIMLASLCSSQATSAHVRAYANTVKECWVKRRTTQLCHSLIEGISLLGPGEELKELILDHLTSVASAASFADDSRVRVLSEYYPVVLSEYDQIANGTKSLVSWEIGYPSIDGLSDGLKPGDLAIIVAPSGMGKSDFMMNCSLNLASSIPVSIFSMEMSARAVTTRMIAMANNKNSRSIRAGRAELTKEFYLNGFNRHPIILDDKRGLTVMDIKARLTRLVSQYGVKVVCIDHKEIIRFHTKSRSDVDNWRAIPQELKRVAGDLSVAVVLLAQPTLEGLRKGKISGADIRNGGFEDADIILSLFRENYQKPYIEVEPLIVTAWKVREGTPGEVTLNYETHSGRITQGFVTPASSLPVSESKQDVRYEEEEKLPF